MNLNKVFLIGRLTRDPETKALPSGQTVTNFGLATSRYFTDKSGEKRQETEFHNIVLFGRVAEIASQYLRKGSLAFLEGRIRTRSWEDSAGNKRYRTEIIVQRMQLGPKSAGTVMPPETLERKKDTAKSKSSTEEKEEIPIIDEGEEEINVKDIPF
jgi:single-strand DNA-binding protein